MRYFCLAVAAAALIQASCVAGRGGDFGQTEITRWPEGKQAAVSITYDGGTINQFKVAVPIMDRLGLPATFFIVTGDIRGSKYRGEFIGRDVEEILRESATVPIDERNFFERATALRYLPYQGAREYHTRAGDLFEVGKAAEARAHIDEAYAKIRRGELQPLPEEGRYENPTVDASWGTIKALAARGYEFGSHSVTHPQPAICDDANLRYELEKSREEILEKLGPEHTFSCEWPHGSANPRVLEVATKIYPALRNRMPADYLDEINRWSRQSPLACTREYVQWQRGPKTSTSLAEMKGWVDTILSRDNIWLVLTFHGVDGIGYEPKTGEELDAFFSYIKAHEDRVWVATFRDATKYIRERMNASVSSSSTNRGRIEVRLGHSLDGELYQVPLTLRTRVPANWRAVEIRQGAALRTVPVRRDERGAFVMYEAKPNAEVIELRRISWER